MTLSVDRNTFPLYLPELDAWTMIPDVEMFRNADSIKFTFYPNIPCTWTVDGVVIDATLNLQGSKDLSGILSWDFGLNPSDLNNI